MAKILGIITAVVLALAALVASKNKSAYETEIANLATEKEALGKEQARLKTTQSTYNKTTPLAEAEAEIAELEKSAENQTKRNEELKQDFDAKTAQVATNKQQLDQIREKTSKIGDLSSLASKMRTTKAEMEELAQTIGTAEAKLANLTAQNKQCESQSNALKQKFDTLSSGQSLPSLNTRIRSIYPAWGFVTLGTGSSGGVVANSTLDVVRGDSTVAKLLVTSVESNTAAASIIPDSMANDTSLMVGDRVTASAQKAATPRN
ncbi:MAG: hypothetical protein KGQ87_03020 [Verrucomicrobia bacterium]|nr:hypothetical protein [Verrucomicrobiota bacterium]